ncbi:zinc finger protein 436-like isoform X2 [Epinephelus moara]|uniref:zinc finger protein 436-like isoform X2 n=1 Tax=Epinephelus moara TaxID=300413 RepID=UPI00214E7997|nr:zinc finger protein 436-like isoform X2 [Epinephelus moara]
MSKVQMLRSLVKQRLTAAAEEIFGLVERTIAEYEEELCRSKEENERQRKLLDAVFNPQLRFHRADVQQLSVVKEEVPPEQQEWSSSVDQEDPEPPHIQGEQEELWISQEGEQLQGLEEDDITKFTSTPVPVKSEDDEEKPQSSQLHQRHTEQMETEAEGEDCGGAEPARNSDPDTHLQPETDDSDDWTETREPQSDVQQLLVVKEEVPPEQQEWSSSVDQEDPEPPHIKEEQEELWISQEGEQLQGLEEDDITKFTSTPVPVKSEDDEEKPQSSQLHQRHTEQMETEAEGEDCGGAEPARNSDPDTHLQPETADKTGESSEPESSSVDLEDPEPPHIKEEQEELWISQEGEQLQGLEEDDITKFTSTPVPVKSEDDEEKPDPDTHLQPETDDSDDWTETREPQSGLNSLKNDQVPVSDVIVSKKPFSCSECGKVFGHSGDLRKHMRSHTGEKPFSCSECGKVFGQSGHLKRHRKSHTGEKPYSCSECGKRFCHSDDRRKHMRSHTGEKPFSCSECGKRFAQNGNLKRHIRSHTGEKPFSCPECGKRFGHSENLKVHMRSHTGEKPFSCSMCSKTFGQGGDLKKHMKVHTGEKPFSCSECGKSFSQSAHLKKHVKSHTGEKLFSCSECGKRFSRSEHLKDHMRYHTGEKPFSCSECGRGFGQSGNLKKHMRSHTGEKPFGCSECRKRFAHSGSLKIHMRSHSGEKPFSCSECGKRFGNSGVLKAHMTCHTGEKPFSCAVCGKSFRQSGNLYTHMRTHDTGK